MTDEMTMLRLRHLFVEAERARTRKQIADLLRYFGKVAVLVAGVMAGGSFCGWILAKVF